MSSCLSAGSSPIPSSSHQRRHRLVAGVGGAATLVLLGSALAVRVASPRLLTHLDPGDNTVAVRAAAGDGPLGGWVLGQTTLRADGPSGAGRVLRATLRAGVTARLAVRIIGPDPRTATVTVKVPPAPTVRTRAVTAGTLAVGFSLPLRSATVLRANAPTHIQQLGPATVVLPRGPTTSRLLLAVTARNGERATVPLAVPGLSRVGWHVVQGLLSQRAPLTVVFDLPMRWTPRGPWPLVQPPVPGRWRVVAANAIAYTPRARWPRDRRLRLSVEGARPAATTGALPQPGTVTISTQGTPGARPGPVAPPPPAATGPEVPVYYFGSPVHRQVYLTIDDGWYPSSAVLTLMRQDHLPITTFLIGRAAAEHLAFWRQFQSAGGVIEDHTWNHPDMAQLSQAAAAVEWARARIDFGRWFQTTPALGRPPYGDLSARVRAAAAQAGLRALVMWSVVVQPGRITTWNGRPIAPGEIVLLHWDPGLPTELRALVADLRRQHLTAAPLADGLPH